MPDLPPGAALVVGIDAYANGISPLHSAVRDARAIAAMLQTDHSYAVNLLIDEQAGADEIVRHLEQRIPETLTGESAFLLYFAGHGIARGDGSGDPEGFVIPHGALPGDQTTWLPMDRIRTALEKLDCRHLLVILDCCFAGSFRWSATRAVVWDTGPLYDSQYERYLRGTAWQALTSAAHDQKALDVVPGQRNTRDADSEGHSPFAAALLRGLAGDADFSRAGHEPDGVITATELYQYVFDELVPPGARQQQTPGIWPLRPDNSGQFIFRNPAVPKQTRPDPPLDDRNNPWPGLRAYSDADAPLFFGREDVIDALIERVTDTAAGPLLPVVGASGTGKSSVVRAGLLPRLTDPPEDLRESVGRWHVVSAARLPADPRAVLDEAVRALGAAPADHRTVLFIDQFEELYTRCRDAAVRDEFLARLRQICDAGTATRVVLTLRSDFEPRPATSDSLGPLWARGRYLVPALTIEEYRDCIIGPAQVKAVYFEPDDLVDDLLEEVMAMPGALPMLSFALSEMYQQAQRRRRESGETDRALTRADYEATGGVVGALHRRASALYDESDPATQATIRRVFLRMVAQDGGRVTRRRISLREIAYADEAEQARVASVVERFVAARLLVADGDSVEPAHDTLVVAWERLQEWLSEDGSQQLVRAVWSAAADWDRDDRPKGMLWDDNPQLPLAREQQTNLNELEQQFVRASDRRRKGIRNRNIGFLATAALAIFLALSYALDSALDAEWARQTRDQIYLGMLERSDFFRIADVLPDDATAGVVDFVDDGSWWLLVEESGYPFVVGRVWGKGRIMAIGHEALFVYADERDESLFVELALYWLGGDDRGNLIVFSDGHEEALPKFHFERFEEQLSRLQDKYQFDVGFVERLDAAGALTDAALLVVGNAWMEFSEGEVAAVERFVHNGGGLLAAGVGWSWIDPYGTADLDAAGREARLAAYPMNMLTAPYGMRWTDGYIPRE